MQQRRQYPVMLVKGAQVYSPEYLGVKDVLAAGGKICAVQEEIRLTGNLEVEVLDGTGKFLFPGFIDNHVHICGGGGEGGFHTRTPEIMLTDITTGGVTTVIGTLGTDAATRSMANLLAKARGLEREGISTYIHTGSYQVPLKTMTGSVIDDIVLIDKIIGVGEVALSDHRSAHPTYDEMARLASDARVGGMLSGKAGTMVVHVGSATTTIDMIEEMVKHTEIPAKHFVPTHMSRNARLLERAMAYRAAGGYVDFTTSTIPTLDKDPEVSAYHTLRMMEDRDIDLSGVTFSSDGQGSLPLFDASGNNVGLDVGKVTSLYEAVKKAVRLDGVAVDRALAVITANPAKVFQLEGKGRIQTGADADLVLVDADTLDIETVVAMGRVMVENGVPVVKGTFEK